MADPVTQRAAESGLPVGTAAGAVGGAVPPASADLLPRADVPGRSAREPGIPRVNAQGPGALRRLTLLLFHPSQLMVRRLALAQVISAAAIVATGAAVRLSESGLGCPTWPTCTSSSLIAGGATGDSLIHRWVEFGNRLVTVVIFVVALAVGLAAWRFAAGQASRRRDLRWLAAAQPAGIAAQALIGGIVVLTGLNPFWVSAHFLLSMALVAAAVALQVRCAEPAGPGIALVRSEVRTAAWLLLAVVALMMTVGTVVTGTGPLAGQAGVPRYQLRLPAVTQLHADIGWLLFGLAIAVALALRLTDAPRRARRLSVLLLAMIGVQGAIGYAQYFAGLPAGLVWVHVSWAVLIWMTVLRLVFALRGYGAAAQQGQSVSTQAAPLAERPVR